MDSDYDYLLKILLIGDSGVGKSCLLLRFCENTYTTAHISTIGVDFKIKSVLIKSKKVKLQIWDTAGQDRFRSAMTSAYYRGAHGIGLVFDLTSNKSFVNIEKWMKEIDKYTNGNVNKILIGNKCDLIEKKSIQRLKAEKLAKHLNVSYFETSARNGINVDKSFHIMVKLIVNQLEGNDSSLGKESTEKINIDLNTTAVREEDKVKKKCC